MLSPDIYSLCSGGNNYYRLGLLLLYRKMGYIAGLGRKAY